MSRPKQNLTPAQRKAYDASMKRLNAQQMKKMLGVGGQKLTQAQIKKLQTSPRKTIGRLGVAATKTMTPADKRKAMQKQRLARRKAIQQQKQRVHTAKTGLDRRQAKTTLKALKVDKKISRANRKGNIGKVKKLTGRLESLTKRNARLRDKQMARASVPKAPPRVTRVTRQPPPPREVPKQKTNRRRAVAVSNVVKRKG